MLLQITTYTATQWEQAFIFSGVRSDIDFAKAHCPLFCRSVHCEALKWVKNKQSLFKIILQRYAKQITL